MRRKPSPRTDAAETEIRQWMVQRRHRPGDRLPADVDLAQMLGVARSTVIAALDRLEDAGLIMRRQGSGTFVREVPLPSGVRQGMEVFESPVVAGRRQGVTLIVSDVVLASASPATAGIAAALGIGPGTPTTRIQTTMSADGRLRLFSTEHVHPEVDLPDPEELEVRIASGEGVLDILVDCGVQVAYGQSTVRARLLEPGEPVAQSLGLNVPTAALETTETTHVASGDAVRHAVEVHIPGSYELQVFRQVELQHAARPRSLSTAHRLRG